MSILDGLVLCPHRWTTTSECPSCLRNRIDALVETLARREIITTDPEAGATCCGSARDADGFCVHRPHHPIYVKAP